jgi:IS5 family transposase
MHNVLQPAVPSNTIFGGAGFLPDRPGQALPRYSVQRIGDQNCCAQCRTKRTGGYGGIALLILKHYLGLSDEMLIERLNTDWCLQCFCGIRLGLRRIRDKNLVSWWRSYIGKNLDIKELQRVLAEAWRPWMEQRHVTMMDATVYESHVRYPTDVKLVWECIQRLYRLLQAKRKGLGERRSRSNYEKHQVKYLHFQKKRKKGKREEKRLRRGLLAYLGRLLKNLDDLHAKRQFRYKGKERKMVETVRKVHAQQRELLYGDKDKVKGRIVSMHKPYVRPIIRGKEIKPVEFGVKVHKVQVSGISFIEYLSYEAYNEGTRLKQSIAFHQSLFGRCSQLAADQIYATNENRKYCSRMGIATSFLAKGRLGKLADQQAQLRSVLGKVRSTVLEGSFGNEKNHYLLSRVRARTQATEIVWVFIGMLAANASLISRRMEQQRLSQSA